MDVTVDQLLARIGAKDVELMLAAAELARLRADNARLRADNDRLRAPTGDADER